MFPPPALPALERLLARADLRIEGPSAIQPWLCERWGITAPYPVAPLLAEFDRLDTTDGGWMFAEPVHLIAHRDRLEMFGARHLLLNAGEAAQLIASLNAHFADRQLLFHAPTPDRWYVRCSSAEIPETTSPYAAHGGSLTDFLPNSRGKMNWRALQNEAQMLFFTHAVNEAREAAGKPTVNGVWFWGGGVLPVVKDPSYNCVMASSDLAVQLARKCAIDVRELSWESIRADKGKGKGNVLAVLDSCDDLAATGDFPAWALELERLDRVWFQPLSRALVEGVLQGVSIFSPGNGRTLSFHLTRRNQLLRFWRRAKPLSSHA